jgi:isopentenyldiphosphate isomerase
MRFTTAKEEIILAERQYANRRKTLEEIGVEPHFRLNHHLKDAVGYKAFIYDRPYERAVSIVKALGE